MTDEKKDKPIQSDKSKGEAEKKSESPASNDEKAKTDEGGKDKKKDEKEGKTPKKPRLELKHKPSTIKRSRLDDKFSPRQTPVSIMFLTGPFKGQVLDMGSAISEYSESRTSNWEQLNEAGGVMSGMNFTTVNPHEFSLAFDYYDPNHDVLQLAWNNEHLQSLIESESSSPPRLLLKVGTSSIKGVVCTSCNVSPDAESALPGGAGFKSCTVQLQLKLLAGKGTYYELAPALGPNPLDDLRNSKNRAELERQGLAKVAKEVLSDCLSNENSQQITDLIEEDKLNDPERLQDLSARSFVNLAASGAINLEDPSLQAKLRQDLAFVMAESESGVSATKARILATALQNGNPDNLRGDSPLFQIAPGGSQTVYESIQSDFNQLSEILQKGELEKIDGTTSPQLRDRANKAFGCGIHLRSNGFAKIGNVGEGDRATLDSLNHLIASDLSDEELARALGLSEDTPETIIRNIRNAHPYTSKAQFVNDLSTHRQRFTGHSLWGGFNAAQSKTLATFNQTVSGSEDAAGLADQLGINEDLAEKIKTKGSIDSREDLLKLADSENQRQALDEVWWNLAGGRVD